MCGISSPTISTLDLNPRLTAPCCFPLGPAGPGPASPRSAGNGTAASTAASPGPAAAAASQRHRQRACRPVPSRMAVPARGGERERGGTLRLRCHAWVQAHRGERERGDPKVEVPCLGTGTQGGERAAELKAPRGLSSCIAAMGDLGTTRYLPISQPFAASRSAVLRGILTSRVFSTLESPPQAPPSTASSAATIRVLRSPGRLGPSACPWHCVHPAMPLGFIWVHSSMPTAAADVKKLSVTNARMGERSMVPPMGGMIPRNRFR